MGSDQQTPQTPPPEAEAAYASFLTLRKKDANADFDAFCAERPGVAGWLRLMRASWEKRENSPKGSGAAVSLHEFIKDRFGDEANPAISLDPKPPSSATSRGRISQRLEQLAARVPKTSRYTLQGEVARGGMGVILKVWDEDLRRTLAMKSVLGKVKGKPGEATPLVDLDNLGRFLEEAQITGQLDHPGIVPVHELGVDGEGRVYFTMRLVRGLTLDKVFKLAREEKEGWTRPRALDILMRICEAMAYAHSKGVIHRDIKPSNIMVGKFGETYVMDWGLAKVIGRKDTHNLQLKDEAALLRTLIRTDRVEDAALTPESPLVTMDGTVVGTPAFMSPEQAEGRVDELDPRSDVYSTGSLLYMLVTGHMPYVPQDKGISPHMVVMLLLAGPPKPVHELDHTVPAELVAICDKAMARKREDRYEDMLQMADDLRAYLEGRVVRAYKTGAVAEFRKWVARNKGIAAAVAMLIVVALGGTALFAYQQRQQVKEIKIAQNQTEKARRDAEANEQRAIEHADTARRNAELAERRSYIANLVAADASLRMHEARDAKRRLAACAEMLRGWEWRHLHLRTDTSSAVLARHEGKVTCVAFSPDGARIASGSDDKTVRLWDAESGQQLLSLLGPTDGVTAIAFSPSGRRIAAASRDTLVWILDAQSGRPVDTLSGHETIVTSVAFSLDGTRLVSGSKDGTARLWNAQTWVAIGELEGDDTPVHAVAFDHEGKRVVTGGEDAVHIWDASAMAMLKTLRAPEAGSATTVAFSPDGRIVAAGFFDKTIRTWDAASGKRVRVLTGHADLIYAIAFSPDGTRIVSGSFDKTIRTWNTETGATISVHLGHDGPVRAVAIDRNGERIVSGSNDATVRIWESTNGNAVITFGVDGDFVSAVDIGPDSRRIASGWGGQGRIHIWDATSGQKLSTIEGKEGGLNDVTFSADGTWIATGGEEDWTARIWDAVTGGLVQKFVGHQEAVTSVDLSPDRRRIASGSADKTVRVWESRSGRPLFDLKGHAEAVTSVAFSPNGRRLASGSKDKTIWIWDMETGKKSTVLAAHEDAVQSVAFDSTGERLASGSADQTIRIWDLSDKKNPLVLTGHAGTVRSVAFSPDDTRLVTGGNDKTVRIWDARTGELLLTLSGHDGWVTTVAFSKDGRRIVSGSFDGTIKVWQTGADGN